MTNILTFAPRPTRTVAGDPAAALAGCFVSERRSRGDVFWLKENAEFLNVLSTSGQALSGAGHAVYTEVYDDLLDRFSFFPQYYRFLISLALDLEDLGHAGDVGTQLIEQTVDRGLVFAELSDLQRGEAARLSARRGVDAVAHDPGLADRLRGFAAQSRLFTVPNKKAAYELTHIVFYLTEYGRKPADLPPEATASLYHVGTMAHLEDNLDLLAEVCVALRFLSEPVPQVWDAMVLQQTAAFRVIPVQDGAVQDQYHTYLVGHWHRFLLGHSGFLGDVQDGGLQFIAPAGSGVNALREVSEALLLGDGLRSDDWLAVRGRVQAQMSQAAWAVVQEVERAVPDFAAFFAGFARAPRATGPVLQAV